ncbi:Putative peptidoglycan binding domain-containing protein [Tistlia consotensis]|uniref:Putative peptidoglycan binding domain-containing protein n=1 Tax=Tistlia consotensis USBA 355 TaxID=560819 RepID=A0A1Y6C813_9PROT|nr:L,D-transpeptidase family protein [Tistlia consotensis]SMF48579.1 Putative peptidoglycan binding domain-containing protein [Tistlia consotensis USBA 355]SNR81014.1 Putative peptidoglycan binding domain-containing protein [Tistlia consotensis]
MSSHLQIEEAPAARRWPGLCLAFSLSIVAAACQASGTAAQAESAGFGSAVARPSPAAPDESRPAERAVERLRAALQSYRSIAAAGGWPQVPEGPKLELGASGPRVELLARRLRATGDLASAGSQTAIFDAELDAAVRRFQARHGLEVDGIVGRNTLAALNVPVEQRIDTIELNIWRLGAEQRDWGERYIAVNTAAPTYQVVEGGRVEVEKPAIVGRPGWPTPELESLVDRLEFNPTWTVPARILRLEVQPKIRRDPGYLARNDMHWVKGQLVQAPGPKNPLGKVKFLFANPYSVYLHDTNNRQLFKRAARFLSHGCVRVAGALDLARLLLRDDPAWPPERIDEVVESGKTVRVELRSPMPLHIVYDTAWVDAAGVVNLRDDVYGRDALIAQTDAPGQQQAAGGCPATAARP